MRRTLSFVAGTAAISLGFAAPAQAAAGSYEVTTSATGISLQVLGNDALTIAATQAFVDATPTARTSGVAATLGGTAVPGTTSSIDITSGTQTDGANCAQPALPTELAALLTIEGICSTSTGAATGLPTARTEAGAGSLALDPAAIAQALADLVLIPISENLAPVFETVENVVDGDVQEQLEAACATAAVPLAEVQQILEDAPLVGGVLTPVTGALPDNNACSVLVQFVANAPQLSDVDATLQALVADLIAALSDLGVIEVSLNATSQVTAAGTLLSGASDFGTVDLALPSLDVAGDVLATVLEGPVGQLLTDIDALIAELGANAPTVPSLAEVVQQVLDTLDIPLLTDPSPLLELNVIGSSASVDVDTDTGAISPAAKAGAIDLTISASLADLLGVPQTTSVGPGDEAIVLAGTPLETRLAVGNATTDETSARGELVTVELFRATQGGIVLNVGETLATGSAGFTPAAAAPSPAPLPVTGGGMVLSGIATMAATLLRRRR